MIRRRGSILLDCSLLFLLFTLLLAPYYTHKYTDQWASIESTFISDAHYLAAHLPHPRWQPLWYTGTRFDYIYPPALRYGTALLSGTLGWWPVKAYHFYTIFFYCLGIPAVYLLVRVAGRSRLIAILSALATGLLSPSLLFFKNMRDDAGPWHTPVRFGVLVRYGEGPHITAMSLLPFALAFAWMALEAKRPRMVALAGILCGLVVSNNFYGATSLAIFYPLLVWSFFITRGKRAMLFPTVAIPLLAYGVTAFWLVPSYLRVTLHNMQYVSEEGNAWSPWVAVYFVVVFAYCSYQAAHNRPDRTWAVFVTGSVVFFGLNVIANHFLNFRVIGEPGRLIPELDLVIILGALLLCEWLWRTRNFWWRVAIIAAVVCAFASSRHYIRHIRQIIQPDPSYQSRVEYRVTDWLAAHMPDARIVSSGTIRFWFDAWHDLTEAGGGSEQGLLNPVVFDSMWDIDLGDNSQMVQNWMQALGADAIYASLPESQEPYKDVHHPERFDKWPLLWDDGQGNKIWSSERRYPARARVVSTAQLAAVLPTRNHEDGERLQQYVDVVEKGPDSPPTIHWPNSDSFIVHAKTENGQSLLVQETFDPNWRAYEGDRPVPIRKDVINFMVVDPPPGDHTIRFEFTMPLENRVGWVFTGITVLALAVLFIRREN